MVGVSMQVGVAILLGRGMSSCNFPVSYTNFYVNKMDSLSAEISSSFPSQTPIKFVVSGIPLFTIITYYLVWACFQEHQFCSTSTFICKWRNKAILKKSII